MEVESTKLLIRYKSFFDLFCVLEFRIKMDFGCVCYFPSSPSTFLVCPYCPMLSLHSTVSLMIIKI